MGNTSSSEFGQSGYTAPQLKRLIGGCDVCRHSICVCREPLIEYQSEKAKQLCTKSFTASGRAVPHYCAGDDDSSKSQRAQLLNKLGRKPCDPQVLRCSPHIRAPVLNLLRCGCYGVCRCGNVGYGIDGVSMLYGGDESDNVFKVMGGGRGKSKSKSKSKKRQGRGGIGPSKPAMRASVDGVDARYLNVGDVYPTRSGMMRVVVEVGRDGRAKQKWVNERDLALYRMQNDVLLDALFHERYSHMSMYSGRRDCFVREGACRSSCSRVNPCVPVVDANLRADIGTYNGERDTYAKKYEGATDAQKIAMKGGAVWSQPLQATLVSDDNDDTAMRKQIQDAIEWSRDNKFTIFYRDGCGPCTDALAELEKHPALLKKVDVTNNDQMQELVKSITGHPTLPVIYANGEKIGGWTKFKQWRLRLKGGHDSVEFEDVQQAYAAYQSAPSSGPLHDKLLRLEKAVNHYGQREADGITLSLDDKEHFCSAIYNVGREMSTMNLIDSGCRAHAHYIVLLAKFLVQHAERHYEGCNDAAKLIDEICLKLDQSI